MRIGPSSVRTALHLIYQHGKLTPTSVPNAVEAFATCHELDKRCSLGTYDFQILVLSVNCQKLDDNCLMVLGGLYIFNILNISAPSAYCFDVK